MKDVLTSIPYAKIEFATEQGIFDIIQYSKNIKTSTLDLDLISLNTDRDVGQDDCAVFNLVLVYRDLWFQNIQGNDFVRIKLGRGKKEETVFFGLVDNIYESTSYIDLVPTRSITITGRGWNKALCQFDIGAIQEVTGNLSSVRGFYENQAQINGMNTPATAIQNVLDYYTNRGIDMEFANGKHWKDYFRAIYRDDGKSEKYGNPSNAYMYQGSLWNYIKELRNAPFYEAFWEIVDEYPTFIVRPTPFNPEDWQDLQLIKVDSSDIDVIDTNIGRSDLETYTVYAVKGESILTEFNNIMGAPIWYKPFYKRYGLRRLQVVSKYIKFNGNGNAIANLDGPISDGNGKLAFPTAIGTPMTSGFGPRTRPIDGTIKNHDGVDLANETGTPVYAADSGKVKGVGYEEHGAGYYIVLIHNNGMETRYYHLKEKPNLSENEDVSRGQKIGLMGSTGNSTGPHLHFEVRINGKAINPAPYIGIKEDEKDGATGSPNPNPWSTSVEFEVAEKTYNEYEINLQEGKRKTDEEFRVTSKIKRDYVKRRNKVSASLDKKTGKIITQRESSDEKDQEMERMYRETEETIADADRTDSSMTSQKTIDLFNWNIKNGIMQNGSLVLRGDSAYKVGTRLLMESTNMEYYIEKVSHNFVYNEGWKTTLQVTRGLYYGDRFKKPWNQWTLISIDDVKEISGFSDDDINVQFTDDGGGSYNPMAYEDPTGFRALIGQIAKSHAGEIYSQTDRMSEGYSDCSSFVYKVSMEAQGKDWRGTWAPATWDMPSSNLWYEIPLNEVQPWDILLKNGHTEFLGDDGRTYGSHEPGVASGPGGAYSPSNWERAFRLKGL